MDIRHLRNALIHLGPTYWQHACQKSGRVVKMPEIRVQPFGEYRNQMIHDLATGRNVPTGIVRYHPEETLGQYFPDEHLVLINSDQINHFPEVYILHALLPHELAHAFEVGSRTSHRLEYDDDPHGRRWQRCCKFFDIPKPSEKAVAWEEVSTLFEHDPEEIKCEADRTARDVEVDETFHWTQHGREGMTDYGDRITTMEGGVFYWPTRTRIFTTGYMQQIYGM